MINSPLEASAEVLADFRAGIGSYDDRLNFIRYGLLLGVGPADFRWDTIALNLSFHHADRFELTNGVPVVNDAGILRVFPNNNKQFMVSRPKGVEMNVLGMDHSRLGDSPEHFEYMRNTAVLLARLLSEDVLYPKGRSILQVGRFSNTHEV